MTLQEQLETGLSHHQAGRLELAEKFYRQVLAQEPNDSDALYLLGVLAETAGQLESALDLFQRAIAVCSTNPIYYVNLGNTLTTMGRRDEAIVAYRNAVRADPDYAEGHGNLGIALMNGGQLDEAIVSYRNAIRIDPSVAEVHNNLGNALVTIGRLDEGIASFQHAIHLKPELASAHNNLGKVFCDLGRVDEAIAACQQAIRIKPDYAEAHTNLGNALKDARRADEAIASHRQAIRIKPDYAEAYSNLGNALRDGRHVDEAIASYHQAIQLNPGLAEIHYNLGIAFQKTEQWDEAIAAYRQAIQLKPDNGDFINNLGGAFKSIGQLDKAIDCYRQAVRLKPDNATYHDNLIFAILYHPRYDTQMIQEELRIWNRQHAEPLKKLIQPHTNDRDPDRRLRIGYVSPDFRLHVVGQNLIPLLREHDHARMEIFCYANSIDDEDRITEQFRGYADVWRNIEKLTDRHAADLILQDRIDILVDLALHMTNNRLTLFGLKPAPIQATFAGYPGSTGLETIDYRLTDPLLDPPGANDRLHSEKSLRFHTSFWCYETFDPDLAVSDLPAHSNGHLTFGCLNTFCKVNEGVLRLWASVLKAVRNSRLMILCPEGSPRQSLFQVMKEEGIQPNRIEVVARRPRRKYLELYHLIDIGLDTLPYNGHTTSLDAMWMGVPTVTLVGQTVVGRAGLSQLTNVGLPELIAQTPEQYVEIVGRLASNIPQLAELRRTLRTRMQASPLTDATRFARGIEAAYRQMWQDWCQQ